MSSKIRKINIVGMFRSKDLWSDQDPLQTSELDGAECINVAGDRSLRVEATGMDVESDILPFHDLNIMQGAISSSEEALDWIESEAPEAVSGVDIDTGSEWPVDRMKTLSEILTALSSETGEDSDPHDRFRLWNYLRQRNDIEDGRKIEWDGPDPVESDVQSVQSDHENEPDQSDQQEELDDGTNSAAKADW